MIKTDGLDADTRLETRLYPRPYAEAPSKKCAANEEVIGALGALIGAPVGTVTLVNVPQILIDAEPNLSHFQAGVSHGSLFVDSCRDSKAVEYATATDNRARLAKLAALYSLVLASDHQVLYDNEPPNRVHSVDHGHFFNGGP